MKLFLLAIGATLVVVPARLAPDLEMFLVVIGAVMLGVCGLLTGKEIERKYPTPADKKREGKR